MNKNPSSRELMDEAQIAMEYAQYDFEMSLIDDAFEKDDPDREQAPEENLLRAIYLKSSGVEHKIEQLLDFSTRDLKLRIAFEHALGEETI